MGRLFLTNEWTSTDHKAVDKREEVRKVLGWVHGETKVRPIIVDGDRPIGIPNLRAFMSRRILPASKVEHFLQPTPALPAGASREVALGRFSETLAPYLPVEERGRLTGYVDVLELLRAFEDGPRAGEAALAVTPLLSTSPLSEAMHRFREMHVDHLPVCDERRRITGSVARAAVMRVEENTAGGKGHADYATEARNLLEEAVGGFADDAWPELPGGTPFLEAREALVRGGYAFVTRLKESDPSAIGVLTPALLARALHATLRAAP